ncbi:putative exonuclease RNase T and DNA polymerase III [Ostreococcus tauri virus 2]|uniref:DNA polymerase exonuclease subunit n=1 Tax=Ostreococcus tauri virus 2 TaxID=696472 RepID=UPI0001EF47D6|nr:DNA polymerase exonuclease subunit [Ostreococcus tauri virus 2]CBI70001.1 putative exonuclease RNase T and DNA polymerase III [Ostreococcus tauri virus 2]
MACCMNYIAFDFETSGLPRGRRNTKVTHETLSNFDGCRAVSLSAARFSQRGRLIKTFDAIIRPNGFQIGEESIAIHGISNEKALSEGRPFPDVFKDFMEFIGPRTKTLVAHNAQFDTSVLQSEMLRHGIPLEQIDDLVIRCTLEMYRDRFMGPIKLTKLYADIFGEEFDNAHNSLADSIACGRVYPYLLGQTERTLKPLPIKKVIIGASSVASAIGINQYKKPQELVEELWKKYSPQTFEGKTKEDEALLVLNSLESTKKILNEAESFKSETSTDVQQETRKLFHQIEHSGLLPQQMVQAKEHIRKTLATNHGTRNEKKTAKFDKMAANLVEDDTFYKYDVCVIEGTLYQIVGRLDRIQLNEDGSRMLVEIKNRTRGLFNRVRDYEEVQCQTYLQMLEDIEYCRLVETYEGESKSYLIQRDYPKWKDEILPKLNNFCEHFHSLLSSA